MIITLGDSGITRLLTLYPVKSTGESQIAPPGYDVSNSK